jgi:type IV pilus assembly protein PilW
MTIQRQRGYTMIEITVALFIGLFLLAGLFAILQNTRRTSTTQTGLTQLQDEQRMAMSMLNDVIQNAGYFDANSYQTALTAWPTAVAVAKSGTTLAVGQPLTGTHTSASPGDVLVARYSTTGSDGVINCTGATGTAGTAATWTNAFYVSSNQLWCTLDGTAGVPLVTGVTNLQAWYGISTQTGVSNVDTYKTATQMSAADWFNVTSVRVTLTFLNPMYSAATSAQSPQYVYFTRVIALQGRTGVVATAL